MKTSRLSSLFLLLISCVAVVSCVAPVERRIREAQSVGLEWHSVKAGYRGENTLV